MPTRATPTRRKAALAWVAEKSSDEGYQAVARLRLAGVLAEAKAYDEALKQLSGDFPKEFEALVADRRGDIYNLQGKKAEAKAEYLKAYKGFDDARGLPPPGRGQAQRRWASIRKSLAPAAAPARPEPSHDRTCASGIAPALSAWPSLRDRPGRLLDVSDPASAAARQAQARRTAAQCGPDRRAPGLDGARRARSTCRCRSTSAATTVAVASSDGTVAAHRCARPAATSGAPASAAPLAAGVGSDGKLVAVVTRANELVALSGGKELWRQKLAAVVVHRAVRGRRPRLRADRRPRRQRLRRPDRPQPLDAAARRRAAGAAPSRA